MLILYTYIQFKLATKQITSFLINIIIAEDF